MKTIDIRQVAMYDAVMPKLVSEALRRAILTAPATRYRIAKDTGVEQSTLSRFISGERGLDLTSVDKVAAYLGLELRPIEKRKDR